MIETANRTTKIRIMDVRVAVHMGVLSRGILAMKL